MTCMADYTKYFGSAVMKSKRLYILVDCGHRHAFKSDFYGFDGTAPY